MNVATPSSLAIALLLLACEGGQSKPLHRERSPPRDAACSNPGRPRAYFYPAENRTDYGPDDPAADGCMIIVPDHLFCCPDAPRPTDR